MKLVNVDTENFQGFLAYLGLIALSYKIIKPTGIYLLKANNNARRRSNVFNVSFEHIPHLVLVFLFLTLNIQLPAQKELIKRNE